MRKNIIFPVETEVRELDYRLLLAIKLANPNRRIFIVQHDLAIPLIKKLRGGVYLGKHIFKTLFPTQLKYYHFLKSKNIGYIHLDEEGGVFNGMENEWRSALKLRLNPTVLNSTDTVCTWGDFQRNYYFEQSSSNKPKIITTGHPRFDLCKPGLNELYKKTANQYKKRHGDYILCNTNLTYAGNAKNLNNSFSNLLGNHLNISNGKLLFLEKVTYHRKVQIALINALVQIAKKYSNLKIVLRPHPAEDHSYYKTILEIFPNIEVIHEGSVIPWILGSKMMIHDGCTTAIEAYLAGKPVLTFKPFKENSSAVFLPNLIGMKCKTEDSLINAVNAVLTGNYTPRKITDPRANHLLYNFEHNTVSSFVKIIEEIEKIFPTLKTPSFLEIYKLGIKESVIYHSKIFLRSLISKKKSSFQLSHQQFPGFNKKTLLDKSKILSSILGKKVIIHFISDRMLLIDGIN